MWMENSINPCLDVLLALGLCLHWLMEPTGRCCDLLLGVHGIADNDMQQSVPESSSKVELLLSAQVHCNYQSLKVSKHHKASATLFWVSRNTNKHPWDVWVLTTKSLKPVASSPSSAPTASCSSATNGGLLDHLRQSKIMPSRASSWAERVS